MLGNEDGKLTVCKFTETARVTVNGQQLAVDTPIELHHNTRLILGHNHLFRVRFRCCLLPRTRVFLPLTSTRCQVVVPAEAEAGYVDPSLGGKEYVDWSFAITEQNQAEIAMVKQQEAQARAALQAEKAKAEEQVCFCVYVYVYVYVYVHLCCRASGAALLGAGAPARLTAPSRPYS